MSEEREYLDVYVARLPSLDADAEAIEHAERRAELEKIKNKAVIREKYYAWRLLETALRERFGRSPSELDVHKDECGGWRSPLCGISLSHTAGAVAVAISSDNVGVDIERDVPPRAKNFAERTLNSAELEALMRLPEKDRGARLVRLWTMKEAIFKSRGERVFVPREIDTADGASCTDTVLGGERFVISVAARCRLERSPRTVEL